MVDDGREHTRGPRDQRGLCWASWRPCFGFSFLFRWSFVGRPRKEQRSAFPFQLYRDGPGPGWPRPCRCADGRPPCLSPLRCVGQTGPKYRVKSSCEWTLQFWVSHHYCIGSVGFVSPTFLLLPSLCLPLSSRHFERAGKNLRHVSPVSIVLFSVRLFVFFSRLSPATTSRLLTKARASLGHTPFH